MLDLVVPSASAVVAPVSEPDRIPAAALPRNVDVRRISGHRALLHRVRHGAFLPLSSEEAVDTLSVVHGLGSAHVGADLGADRAASAGLMRVLGTLGDAPVCAPSRDVVKGLLARSGAGNGGNAQLAVVQCVEVAPLAASSEEEAESALSALLDLRETSMTRQGTDDDVRGAEGGRGQGLDTTARRPLTRCRPSLGFHQVGSWRWCSQIGAHNARLVLSHAHPLRCPPVGGQTDSMQSWLDGFTCVYAVSTTLWLVATRPGAAPEHVGAWLAARGATAARVFLAGDARTVGVLDPWRLSASGCPRRRPGRDSRGKHTLSGHLHCSFEVRCWARGGRPWPGVGVLMTTPPQSLQARQLLSGFAFRSLSSLTRELDAPRWRPVHDLLHGAASSIVIGAPEGSLAALRLLAAASLPAQHSRSLDSVGMLADSAACGCGSASVGGSGCGGVHGGVYCGGADITVLSLPVAPRTEPHAFLAAPQMLDRPPSLCHVHQVAYFGCIGRLSARLFSPDLSWNSTPGLHGLPPWPTWPKPAALLLGGDGRPDPWRLLGGHCDSLLARALYCIAVDFPPTLPVLPLEVLQVMAAPVRTRAAQSHQLANGVGAVRPGGIRLRHVDGQASVQAGWQCVSVMTVTGVQSWLHVTEGTRMEVEARGLSSMLVVEDDDGALKSLFSSCGVAAVMAPRVRARACLGSTRSFPSRPWHSSPCTHIWHRGSTFTLSRLSRYYPSPLLLRLQAWTTGPAGSGCTRVLRLPRGRPAFMFEIRLLTNQFHVLVDGLLPIISTMLARWGRIRHDALLFVHEMSELGLQLARDRHSWSIQRDDVHTLLFAVFDVRNVADLLGVALDPAVEFARRKQGECSGLPAPGGGCGAECKRKPARVVLEANEATFIGLDFRFSPYALASDARAPPSRMADMLAAWAHAQEEAAYGRDASLRFIADAMCSQRAVYDALRRVVSARLRALRGRVEARATRRGMVDLDWVQALAQLPDVASGARHPTAEEADTDTEAPGLIRPQWLSTSCHRLCLPFMSKRWWPAPEHLGRQPDTDNMHDAGVPMGWSRRATRHLFVILPHRRRRSFAQGAQRALFDAAAHEASAVAQLWSRTCALCLTPAHGERGPSAWAEPGSNPSVRTLGAEPLQAQGSDVSELLGLVGYLLSDLSLSARYPAREAVFRATDATNTSDEAMRAVELALSEVEARTRSEWGGHTPLSGSCEILAGCSVSQAAASGRLGTRARAEAEDELVVLGSAEPGLCRTVACGVRLGKGGAEWDGDGDHAGRESASARRMASEVVCSESAVRLSVAVLHLERVPFSVQQHLWRRTLVLFGMAGQALSNAVLMPAGSVLVQALPRGHLSLAFMHGNVALLGGVHVVTLRAHGETYDSGWAEGAKHDAGTADRERSDHAVDADQVARGMRAALLLSVGADVSPAGSCAGAEGGAASGRWWEQASAEGSNAGVAVTPDAGPLGAAPWFAAALRERAAQGSVAGLFAPRALRDWEVGRSGWVRFAFARHLEVLLPPSA